LIILFYFIFHLSNFSNFIKKKKITIVFSKTSNVNINQENKDIKELERLSQEILSLKKDGHYFRGEDDEDEDEYSPYDFKDELEYSEALDKIIVEPIEEPISLYEPINELSQEFQSKTTLSIPESLSTSPILKPTSLTRPKKINYFKRMPLIIGCGRTGTHSVSTAFLNIGLSYYHENVAGVGGVSWPHTAIDTVYPFEKFTSAVQRKRGILYEPIIHLVRNPLDVIRSVAYCFCGRGNLNLRDGRISDSKSWAFAKKHVYIPQNETRVVQAAYYWVNWNLLAESRNPERRFQIEKLNDEKQQLFDFLHEQYPKLSMYTNKDLIRKFSIPIGASSEVKTEEVTWKLLEQLDPDITQKAKELALKYGYPITDEETKTMDLDE